MSQNEASHRYLFPTQRIIGVLGSTFAHQSLHSFGTGWRKRRGGKGVPENRGTLSGCYLRMISSCVLLCIVRRLSITVSRVIRNGRWGLAGLGYILFVCSLTDLWSKYTPHLLKCVVVTLLINFVSPSNSYSPQSAREFSTRSGSIEITLRCYQLAAEIADAERRTDGDDWDPRMHCFVLGDALQIDMDDFAGHRIARNVADERGVALFTLEGQRDYAGAAAVVQQIVEDFSLE